MQLKRQYLDSLIDPSFQGGNRLFVLSFENIKNTAHTGHYFPNVEIRYFDFMTNGRNVFDRPVNSNIKT